MSEQRTAPRWEDVPEEARESVRIWLGSMRRAQADVRDDARFTSHARQTADDDVRAIDAALARLAEPAQPSAAERWRAVPADAKADARMIVEGEIAGCQGDGVCPECDALRALLALAREAEGGR